MGAGISLDTSKLDVCFGGFTPMALGDGVSSRWRTLEAEERARARRAQLEAVAAIEAARASEVCEQVDEAGAVWRYVVLDGAEVRVERCETRGPRLDVPAEIEGKPVVALAADACAFLPTIEEATCPDSVISVGPCAFRGGKSLRKVVLSKELAAFDSDWLRGCPNVEDLTLPGRLAKLGPEIFDLPGLRTLRVGATAEEVEPGAFAKSRLERIEVDPSNPFLTTDGRALYRRDGRVLVALAVPGPEYRIGDGCRAVAKKGFSGFACLERVEVPESLELLGDFALSRTGISSFESSSSLRRVGEKAFFNCSNLEEVRLREGLTSVGANAFTGTALRELRLPSSVEELGHPLAGGTGLTYAGAAATFSIAAGSRLELDEAGGLYRKDGSGRRLVRMMDQGARRYVVGEGTLAVDEAAFANHAGIVEAVLPEGLEAVGKAAFKGCRNLVRVDVPSSLRSIGDEAFLDTGLASLRLPAALARLGANALVTRGAHHGAEEPSLREVAVDAGNERFYRVPGLLLERTGAGRSRVVLCTGDVAVVRIPEEVDEIAPYAFNGVAGIRELHLSDRITNVGIRGLAVDGLVELIHLDLVEPVFGHESFDIRFPDTDRGVQQMMLALSVPDHVDAAVLFEHYDNAIINGSSFDAESDRGLRTYDQAVRIAERLLDPVFLTPVNRSMCDRALRCGIGEICVDVARHDDRKTFDVLMDLGYLNADNVRAVIERVAALQDAAMTGYLLEARRLRFEQAAPDFDL